MVKTESDPDLKIIMVSFDGAEISGLVDVYIFIKLHEKCGKEKVDLYRDNDLSCFEILC